MALKTIECPICKTIQGICKHTGRYCENDLICNKDTAIVNDCVGGCNWESNCCSRSCEQHYQNS
jgi:hypothetical protein